MFWRRPHWRIWIIYQWYLCGASVDRDWECSPWRCQPKFSEAEVVVLLPSLPHRSRCSGCRLCLVWVIWRNPCNCLLVTKLWSILIWINLIRDLETLLLYKSKTATLQQCNICHFKIVQEVWSIFSLQHTVSQLNSSFIFLKLFSCMSSVFQDVKCIIYDFCQCCGHWCYQ